MKLGIKSLRRIWPVALAVVLTLTTTLTLAPPLWANEALDQALSYFKTGKYAEAAAEFQTLVDGAPNYDFGYFMLGLSLLKMGKTKQAQDNVLKAIELNGDKFEYHNGLATVYFTEKNYAKAVAALKTAEPLASSDQQKFALYTLRGSCYAALKKWPDAAEDLEKAKSINSKQVSVLVALGQAYFKLGHYDKTVPVLKEAVKLNPGDTKSALLLSESLLNLGAKTRDEAQKSRSYREALTYAEKVQQAKPNSFEANNLVGRAALGSKDYPKAERAFAKVLAQKSDYCYAMVNLGKTYIAQKNWSEAESILEDAAVCSPRMAVVYESLGFVVQKQNRLDEAIAWYEKAYEIKPSGSVRNSIETCKTNLEVQQHNKMVASTEAEQNEAERKAQEEYEAELEKQKEWEERKKKDD